MKTEHSDESMRLMAELLSSLMPPNWGFTLLTFELNNDAAKVLYISSAERESMIGTMRTMLDKWEMTKDFDKPNLN